jgi:thioredoxin 1
MHFLRGTMVGLMCLAAVLLLAGQPGGPSPAQAAPGGKPALYEFGARYCVSCKEMAKIMAELKAQYGEQVDVRMIYADKEKEMFKQYKIMLIPTQVFVDAGGKEVDRHIGALSKDQVLAKLKELKFIH